MTEPLGDLGLGLASDVIVWQALLLTALSFAVGILGGFVGLALGTMRLPALLLIGVPPLVAAGTNIFVSTASALTGSVRHLRDGRVDPRVVAVMGVPSMAGAFLGAFNSQYAPEALLLLIVGGLVLWQGVELIQRARRDEPARRKVDAAVGISLDRNQGLATAGAGLAIGLLGGAVGLILGSMRLPAMIRILRVDPRAAAGTNLFIGFAMGLVGWTGHVVNGRVDYPLAAMMAATAMAGSYLGARLTGRVRLNRLVATMGIVLVVVGTILIWRGVAA